MATEIYSPDHIISQIDSLLGGDKTPEQIRTEDGIYKSSGDTNPTATFSPEEEFKLKAEGYANLGDNVMSTLYGDLANSLGQYSSYANSTLGGYDKLLNFMAGNEGKLQQVAGSLYNDLVKDLNNQKSYINNMFGPNGTLTKEVDTYYDDLGNYLASDAGRQAATIAAQGMHSGASLGAIRAQQNEAYNQSFARYVQAKEQQINAKQQIASNLINFMSTLRKEYGDTTNQYIIELYKRAYDLYNSTAISTMSDLSALNKLRLSGSGSSSSINDILKDLINIIDNSDGSDGNGTDGNGITKNESQAQEDAKTKLGQKLDNDNNIDYANMLGYIMDPTNNPILRPNKLAWQFGTSFFK